MHHTTKAKGKGKKAKRHHHPFNGCLFTLSHSHTLTHTHTHRGRRYVSRHALEAKPTWPQSSSGSLRRTWAVHTVQSRSVRLSTAPLPLQRAWAAITSLIDILGACLCVCLYLEPWYLWIYNMMIICLSREITIFSVTFHMIKSYIFEANPCIAVLALLLWQRYIATCARAYCEVNSNPRLKSQRNVKALHLKSRSSQPVMSRRGT